MIDEEEGCLKIAQQLYAVEKAITQAKKNIIHDNKASNLKSKLTKRVNAIAK